MKNKGLWLVLVLILLVLTGLTFYSVLYHNKNTARIVYVDLKKIHSEFLMKKQLEAKLKNSVDARNLILDSLKLQIEALDRKFVITHDQESSKKYKILAEQFNKLDQEYKRDNGFQTNEYDKEIWNQLDQYLKEYREQKEYDLILGTSGNGNIMSANPKFEITDDVIVFINKKYAGK